VSCREVTTQAELDAALEAGDCPHLVGSGYFVVRGSATVRASGSATVRASDSATVRASGSATVRASGSATVRASGSATVEAWDSATVEASGSATVRAWDSVLARLLGAATLTAESPFVVTTVHGKRAKALGKGSVHAVPDIETVEAFLGWYGATPTGRKDPTVVLYKAVNDQWRSGYGTSYAPGEKPEAADWDGGKNRCGGGLHLSPTPHHALRYALGATRFVACTVRVTDLALIYSPGEIPDKCKAPRVLKCEACDADGVVS
jgi:hypothetical protein